MAHFFQKNGYVIKLKEENENVQSTNQLSENQTKKQIIPGPPKKLKSSHEISKSKSPSQAKK